MIAAVLFDLDGTLLDTLQDIADACNAALARHGLPIHPVDAYRYFVGEGVPMLISRTVPKDRHDPALLEKLAAEYREEYRRNWNASTRPYDGVPELLDQLSARKVCMSVLSNKPHEFTERCVSEFLSRWKFDVVQGASAGLPPKPDPAGALEVAEKLNVRPGDVLYLGDTATDMKTSVGAGMLPVGALWGFRTAEELKSAGARHLIAHPEDVLKLL